MTKDEFHKWISKYEFKKYANFFKSKNGHAAFDGFQIECKEHGYVYLWAEEVENEFNIVYIGKAEKTMKSRCNQHLGGITCHIGVKSCMAIPINMLTRIESIHKFLL